MGAGWGDDEELGEDEWGEEEGEEEVECLHVEAVAVGNSEQVWSASRLQQQNEERRRAKRERMTENSP